MARLLLPTLRSICLASAKPSLLPSTFCALTHSNSSPPVSSADPTQPQPSDHPRIEIPHPIPGDGNPLGKGFRIELVDSDVWGVSFGLAEALQPSDRTLGVRTDGFPAGEDCHDSDDEIEDLRLHKRLFYKLDRGSKEYQENNVNFHHRKRSSSEKNSRGRREATKSENKKLTSAASSNASKAAKEKARNFDREKAKPSIGSVGVESKRVRVPTFNQLTDPYHLPFCLDIFITKGSVRACVVHRVTSKVVAVAHSISKDMKFDLNSRKDAKACAAVGAVLAKRAIEDDIHNVVYTPRKGDNIEGKIEIVLRAINEHGVDVKVKLKQKRQVKGKAVHIADPRQNL